MWYVYVVGISGRALAKNVGTSAIKYRDALGVRKIIICNTIFEITS